MFHFFATGKIEDSFNIDRIANLKSGFKNPYPVLQRTEGNRNIQNTVSIMRQSMSRTDTVYWSFILCIVYDFSLYVDNLSVMIN